MKGGKPQGVSISLQMQEMQIQTAEDYGAEGVSPSEATALVDVNPANTITGGDQATSGGAG
jgi:hypothetical protein